MTVTATRGSRRMLRALTDDPSHAIRSVSPSRRYQIAVACGLPSAISVASVANATLSSRSRSAWESAIVGSFHAHSASQDAVYPALVRTDRQRPAGRIAMTTRNNHDCRGQQGTDPSLLRIVE